MLPLQNRVPALVVFLFFGLCFCNTVLANPSHEAFLQAVEPCSTSLDSLIVLSGFSPNGDGQNDTFTILGAEKLDQSRLMIFDRSGIELYSAESYRNDWDGNPAALPLSENEIYLYVFEDGLGQTYSGQFRINK